MAKGCLLAECMTKAGGGMILVVYSKEGVY